MTEIDIRNIDVHFPIYDARARSFRQSLLGMGAARIGATATHHVVVRALNDISLSLTHGDRLGLVGRNGAGKSTLLRVMTGTYEPGAGSVHIEGRVAALTDITMGMDLEATGYENILIRGLMLGQTRRQSMDRIAEIEAFYGAGRLSEPSAAHLFQRHGASPGLCHLHQRPAGNPDPRRDDQCRRSALCREGGDSA